MWQNTESSEIIRSICKTNGASASINAAVLILVTVYPHLQTFFFFLGHPAPQLVWYKEDVQLDRYCGLPKYEIAHNGHHHSLHIYKYVCLETQTFYFNYSGIWDKGKQNCFCLTHPDGNPSLNPSIENASLNRKNVCLRISDEALICDCFSFQIIFENIYLCSIHFSDGNFLVRVQLHFRGCCDLPGVSQ